MFTSSAIVGLSRSFLVVGGVCELSDLFSSSSSSSLLRFEPAFIPCTDKQRHRITPEFPSTHLFHVSPACICQASTFDWSYRDIKKIALVWAGHLHHHSHQCSHRQGIQCFQGMPQPNLFFSHFILSIVSFLLMCLKFQYCLVVGLGQDPAHLVQSEKRM